MRSREPGEQEVTPEELASGRRRFLRQAGMFAATAAGTGGGLLALMRLAPSPLDPVRRGSGTEAALRPLPFRSPSPFDAPDGLTDEHDATHWNNYYELGLDKGDPSRRAATLRTRPWTVEVDGECARPGTYDVDALIRRFPPEQRIYRMRCVEAWSMVIPWVGFPLGDLIRFLEPGSSVTHVAFETLLDPEQLPGQKSDVLGWPYVEGLRLDEALHPLTLLAVGMYGKVLPGQNGAPIRLVVPWKYGFKGIKSIVRIRFLRERPPTTWNLALPSEYGFFANVNPEVDHPRWSQASERRIGELERRPTLPFNGYSDQVGSLYSALDLRKNF